ncbi:hypothetical protein LguiA_036701 [Lonicera macranthoides]
MAELCLYHIPYPYDKAKAARFLHHGTIPFLTLFSFIPITFSPSPSPFLFVSAFHKSTSKIQWQALNPRSGRWFVLPPMPSLANAAAPTSFTCTSLPRDGKLLYSMLWTPYADSAVGNIKGNIVVARANDNDDNYASAELYDQKNETWANVAKMRYKMEKHDSVVMGGKLYVTEGWRWPFRFSPTRQV